MLSAAESGEWSVFFAPPPASLNANISHGDDAIFGLGGCAICVCGVYTPTGIAHQIVRTLKMLNMLISLRLHKAMNARTVLEYSHQPP